MLSQHIRWIRTADHKCEYHVIHQNTHVRFGWMRQVTGKNSHLIKVQDLREERFFCAEIFVAVAEASRCATYFITV